jgi:hypothetical protein
VADGRLRYDRFEAAFGQVTFPNPVTGVNSTPTGFSVFNQINGMVSWRAGLDLQAAAERNDLCRRRIVIQPLG